MADATIANNAATGAAGPAASPPTQFTVSEAPLRQLPEKLQNLTRPVVVTGTVIASTPDGMTRVRTAAGEVQLQSPAPLAADRPVTLQIPAGNPPASATMLVQTSSAPPSAQPQLQPQPPGAAAVLQQAVTTPATTTPTAPAPGIAAGTQTPVQNAAQNSAQTAATPVLTDIATAQAALPTAAAPLLTVGTVLPALVLAINPRPTAAGPAAPGSGDPAAKTGNPAAAGPAADGSEAGEGKVAADRGGTTGGGPAAASGRNAAPATGGSATLGKEVSLGGDAAHRGTIVEPPPGQPRPPRNDDGGTTDGRRPDGQPPPSRMPAQTPTALPTGEGAADRLAGDAIAAKPGASARPAVGLNLNDLSAPPAPPTPPGAPTADARAAAGNPLAANRPGTPGTPAAAAPLASGQPQPPATDDGSRRSAPPPAGEVAMPARQPTAAAVGVEPQLRPGQALALKVVSVAPPGSGGAPPVQADSHGDGPRLEGVIAGTTPQGKPVLATRDGMVALNTDRGLPPGTRLSLEIADPATLARPSAALAAAADLPDYLQGSDWPALRQVLAALREMDPALAHNLISAAIPQPGRKLGATLSFLLSAVRGGDARGWLGSEATQALASRGKEELIETLRREIRDKDTQHRERLPDDWQAVTLPMYDQSGLNPLHLAYMTLPPPHDEQTPEKEGGPKGCRFVLDVDLSRLGPMQLDGLVKSPRFDLVLRSRTALPVELRQELRDVFATCLEVMGYSGGITFQSDIRSWVRLTRTGSSSPAVSA